MGLHLLTVLACCTDEGMVVQNSLCSPVSCTAWSLRNVSLSVCDLSASTVCNSIAAQ